MSTIVFVQGVMAWGSFGHSVTGHMAQELLSVSGLKLVERLLDPIFNKTLGDTLQVGLTNGNLLLVLLECELTANGGGNLNHTRESGIISTLTRQHPIAVAIK
ncbi:hypothetical protein BC829DRAFT_31597 [Chytridium lagenaria]|nr:hypothetical protein BC829DRAFT_31597 [Chytridium lagenaria]